MRILLTEVVFTATLIIGISEVSSAQTEVARQGERPVATKMLEVGTATNRTLSNKFRDLFKSLDPRSWSSWDPAFEMIIINYGTNTEIVNRERILLQARETVRLPHARMTVVRGGMCKPKSTISWQVPRGAELPEVCEKPN